jgi:hypothetical protein
MRKWHAIAFSTLLTGHFLYFNWDGLFVHFAADDMMNMATTWRLGPWILLAQFMPWYGFFYRPLSGLLQIPLVYFFGLNPIPFHAAVLLIILVNTFLTYRLARLLGCTEWAAAVAAILVAYHPGLANLYYNKKLPKPITFSLTRTADSSSSNSLRVWGKRREGQEEIVKLWTPAVFCIFDGCPHASIGLHRISGSWRLRDFSGGV